MCATFAGTPSLSLRRKSITRYARLWPPPWWRVVTLPWTLRPPLPCSGRISDFSGVERVISAKSETLEPRRPGVVGLYLRIPMSVKSSVPDCSSRERSSPLPGRSRRCSEQVDRLATGGQRDDRALGALTRAIAGAGALALSLAVERVHGIDLDAEDLLDRNLDLRLVRIRVHDERVGVVLD